MRNYIVLFVLILWGSLAVAGPERLDPLLRYLYSSWERLGTEGLAALGLPGLLSLSSRGPTPGTPMVRVILRTETPGAGWDLPGFRPRTVVGKLATGVLPITALPELSEDPEIVYIQASRPLRPCLDISVPEVGAPDVWNGVPPTAGEGVILGIVDTGVDTFHPAFRADRDGNGTLEGSRILWLWDQTAPGPPDRWPLGYGEDYSRAEIEGGIASGVPVSRDTSGHGTHVAGIAAGAEPSLPGIAPGAELVVVKSTFYEDTVVDGVEFVFRVAESLGLPAVVNLSLGGHGGPHDGTSLFEQAIDATLDRPGRVVVVAAGNEAEDGIHVGGVVYGPTTWHVHIQRPSGEASFWHEAAAGFQVTVSLMGEELVVPPGTQGILPVPPGEVFVDNASQGPDPRNGDKTIHLTWTSLPPGTYLALTFAPAPAGGRIDGWLASPEYGRFQEGDSAVTIAEPGNAFRVITVGAYTTRNRWVSRAGTQTSEYELYGLAPFSSHGPTRDGRVKPEMAAPGAWILSALSRDSSASPMFVAPDGIHRYMAGTSMAAPHVAGICALLLSLAPDSTWEEIRAALVGGTRKDIYTGWALPDPAWGYGKAYAPGAVAELAPPAPGEVPAVEVLTMPATSEAIFRYSAPEGTVSVSLRIYDLLGRMVHEEELPSDGHIARWDLVSLTGNPVANGIYLAVLVTDLGVSAPAKLVVQR